jgi:hypothetical protein
MRRAEVKRFFSIHNVWGCLHTQVELLLLLGLESLARVTIPSRTVKGLPVQKTGSMDGHRVNWTDYQPKSLPFRFGKIRRGLLSERRALLRNEELR